MPSGTQESPPPLASPAANRYDRAEWAGAFGDLGTLVPFVAAYIVVVKMEPSGVLFGFGLAMLACGLFYRTPFPVQPMKAIGAVAATQAVQTASVTPAAIYAAALATGAFWLGIGLTGAARRVAAWLAPSVTSGIVLGLGLGFVLEGAKLMQTNWWLAAAAAAMAVLLLNQRRVPAMFVLLAFGAAASALGDPDLLAGLARVSMELKLPTFGPGHISWNDMLVGGALLALPQIPLTLGNAVIAIKEENNRLFPDRPVSERLVAISTGVMNVFAGCVGGVPMCHGAGGMAGHVAFGARTGGALVVLGAFLLLIGLFFSGSVGLLLKFFPAPVLGVVLAISGAQLAGGASFSGERPERIVTLVTAAFCMWNVGIGIAVGIALHHLNRVGLFRL